MSRFFITMLRFAILFAGLAGIFGQVVVIPGAAADEVESFPPYAPYEAPYVTIAILGVACVQAALVAVWMLLAMIERDALFTPKAFRWVDTIIGASAAATLLALGVSVHLFFADIPSPYDGMELIGALGAALACAGVGASFAMLMVVMRGRLRKATQLQAEMSEVV